MAHQFLSDAWIDAALELQEEYGDRLPSPEHTVSVNLVLNEHPFSDEPLEFNVDTSSGTTQIRRGHADDADATLTTTYEIARAAFVSGDQTTLQQSFMSGQILVQGDMAKLMAMQVQAMQRTEVQEEVAERLKEITAP